MPLYFILTSAAPSYKELKWCVNNDFLITGWLPTQSALLMTWSYQYQASWLQEELGGEGHLEGKV